MPRNAKIIDKAFKTLEKNGLEMPILMDHRGRTAFDRVLGVGDLSDRYGLFMDSYGYYKKKIQKKEKK